MTEKTNLNILDKIKKRAAFEKDLDMLVGCHGSLLNHFTRNPPTLIKIENGKKYHSTIDHLVPHLNPSAK